MNMHVLCRCECVAGRGGPTCAERRMETRLADVSIRAGAVAIIVVCIVLLIREYIPANSLPRRLLYHSESCYI